MTTNPRNKKIQCSQIQTPVPLLPRYFLLLLKLLCTLPRALTLPKTYYCHQSIIFTSNAQTHTLTSEPKKD